MMLPWQQQQRQWRQRNSAQQPRQQQSTHPRHQEQYCPQKSFLDRLLSCTNGTIIFVAQTI
jgi:hypothetical protein